LSPVIEWNKIINDTYLKQELNQSVSLKYT